MQSEVIRTGEPLLTNDVRARVKEAGTFYDVDSSGTFRRLPDEGETSAQAAMMVPIKHEGRVAGVVQVMSDRAPYSPDDLELVQALVGQMAAAVRNARLHAERARARANEAAAQAVAAEREEAARVLEALGDGVFVVDARGSIRVWNGAAAAVTGVSRDDAVGAAAAEVFARWDELNAAIPVAEGGEAAHSVTLPVAVAERELWLSFVAVRTTDAVVYAVRDMTAERRIEDAKSAFVATVSHELRTPLTAVLGAARTLLREDVELAPAVRRRLLEMIASEASRLSHVADDVLLATSLDVGDLRLSSTPIDVGAIVNDAVEALRPRLPRGFDVTVEVDGAVVVGDTDRIRQVLVNLLDNAVKYSPHGGAVHVTAVREGRSVRIAVADEGIGIERAEQERVFERFYRSDPNLEQSPGGTGLGLYIARELVERMGGRIAVESEPGGGSTFSFVLPAA
jgi:two-component system phosphate regulon sensor histidine kinase PhoR